MKECGKKPTADLFQMYSSRKSIDCTWLAIECAIQRVGKTITKFSVIVYE
jgi:hypothetical protein